MHYIVYVIIRQGLGCDKAAPSMTLVSHFELTCVLASWSVNIPLVNCAYMVHVCPYLLKRSS